MIKLTSIFLNFLILFVHLDSAFSAPTIDPITIEESYIVEASEISGLAWRTDPKSKRLDLVIISDREHAIFLID